VFVLLAAFLFTLLLAFLANLDVFAQNLLWLGLLLLFIVLVWKYNFILMLRDYERAVIMRFGKVVRVGGPGWCIVLPAIEEAAVVDLRTQTVDVPKQDVITKENIELKIDSVIYLRVKKDNQSIINSVVEVADYKRAIQLYIISSLRDVIGSMTLPDVIANTQVMEERLKKEATRISQGWGVEIVSVDIKDVDIPQTVLDAMHEEKAAVQRKLARMESAQAHMAEIEAVRKAAENLSDKALAYYYVRALEKLGMGKSTKFIFPMELSKLAEAVGGRVSGRPPADIEGLFKKYAPAITGILSQNEKERIKREIKKKR
jgi:regulator of protease activity HflC (stomatin/prohibitin superfamily)